MFWAQVVAAFSGIFSGITEVPEEIIGVISPPVDGNNVTGFSPDVINTSGGTNPSSIITGFVSSFEIGEGVACGVIVGGVISTGGGVNVSKIISSLNFS